MKYMKCLQTRLSILLGFLIMLFSSLGWADNHWLVAVLSGNARVDAWLIPLDKGDDHKPRLHNIADSKTNPVFAGHYGNIAYGKFAFSKDNAEYLTAEVLKQMLPEVASLRDDEKLGEDPTFSFMYAIAGLDAVDGLVSGYSPTLGRIALQSYERIVDEQFAVNGIALDTLVGVHDGSLFLNTVQAAGTVADSLIIYDDTYGIGYRLENGAVVAQSSAKAGKVPAGGYFHLGFQGGELLASEDPSVADGLNKRLREFWSQKGVQYSADEIRLRYVSSNRNELGGVMSALIRDEGNDPQGVDSKLKEAMDHTVESLAQLSLKVRASDPDQPVLVKIIGYYGNELSGFPALEKHFKDVTGGTVIPELIHGDQLDDALTTAAANVFQQVMKARYGMTFSL